MSGKKATRVKKTQSPEDKITDEDPWVLLGVPRGYPGSYRVGQPRRGKVSGRDETGCYGPVVIITARHETVCGAVGTVCERHGVRA